MTTTQTPQITDQVFDAMVDSIVAHSTLQLAAIGSGDTTHEIPDFEFPSWMGIDGQSYGSNGQPDYSHLPSDVKSDFSAADQGERVRVEQNQTNVSTLADKLSKREISDDEFDKHVDDQTKENIDKYTQSQKDLGQKLKDRKKGKTTEQRQGMLAAFCHAAVFLKGIWDKVKGFLDKVVEKLNEIVKFFTNAWNNVKDWFSRAFGW
ncbi:hypothetical protein NE236_08210 [Actinoallomurus purpureus]|uniref:hypothetical protein n=1 Tax=Actinoallomurus purpureus TaxID=478114 RepID=UPI002093F51F|nr:hypothetical protein [Actinoallomurus purpureus]MCO6004963.1 hypothetical protein [Actinoallomurus purpureus]